LPAILNLVGQQIALLRTKCFELILNFKKIICWLYSMEPVLFYAKGHGNNT